MRDSRTIQRLFDDISPTYDLLNRVLSLGNDQRWRRQTARLVADRPGGPLLDSCGGTGDLALQLVSLYPGSQVVLVDFAETMLRLARAKIARAGAVGQVLPVAGDACVLPLRDESCAAATVAFGLRNLTDVAAGLREIHRVLKVGGRLAILEFFRPEGLLASARARALQALVPLVTRFIAPGRVGAYRYLVNSIAEFMSADEMLQLLDETGFRGAEVYAHPLAVATIIGATRE